MCSHSFSGRHGPTNSGPDFRYINIKGDTVIAGPFANALPFSNGIALVSVRTDAGDRRYGTIDRTGAWQIKPKFDSLFEFSDGLAAAQIDNPDHTAKIAGFIDLTGEFVVTLDNVQRMKSSHHNGLALVWRTTAPKHIFVDREGKTVLTPHYEQAEPFHEGMAGVLVGQSWGYIDRSGKEIIPPEYFAPTPFDNGMVAVVQIPAHLLKPIASWIIEEEDGNEIPNGELQ